MDQVKVPQVPAGNVVQAYAGAAAMVALSTLVGLWMTPHWGTGAVNMIYLPAVLAAAALWGLGPGLSAAVLSALAYNFFFTEPVHTFRMDRVVDVVTVVVLLLVALVTSRLAAGIRAQAQLAGRHAARNATIAGFAGRLLSCSGEQEIAEAACARLHELFESNAMLVTGLPEPTIVAAVPPGNVLTPSDIAAAVLTISEGTAAGRGTSRVQPAEWVFHAVRSGAQVLGAIGLARDDGRPPVAPEQVELLASLLDQTALALERARLEQEAHEFASVRDRDRIRATLLSSIRQELGPPVAFVTRAARQLRRGSGDKELGTSLASEALKLERFISNLLELAPEAEQHAVAAGQLSIDLFQRTVSKAGEQVHLTPKEYSVLAELARHPGRVLSHGHLLRTVWGPAQEGQIEYLRVAIRSLRQKLEATPSRPSLIINEPGVGYRLAA